MKSLLRGLLVLAALGYAVLHFVLHKALHIAGYVIR